MVTVIGRNYTSDFEYKSESCYMQKFADVCAIVHYRIRQETDQGLSHMVQF